MKYILDTSAWYAALTADDKHHERARAIIIKRPHFVVPYPVFEELIALVHSRMGKAHVLEAMGRLFTSPFVEILYLSDVDNHEIWELYQKSESYLDFVDCSVIWAAKKLQLPVFTFDKHFERTGFMKE